jgi:N-methylhydantoinase A
MKRLGIDTGGTFTDFVYNEGGKLRVYKVLSTPKAPEKAILQGIAELGITMDDLQIIHGSTVATNALLEGKGVRTVYITNRGFGDVLTIGRQARRELYNLQPEPSAPPVPPELCLETGGRRASDGNTLDPLTEADIAHLCREVEALQPQAIAINLLFSFLDAHDERRIAAAMPADISVSYSSSVLNEYREYERGLATWLNAYVGPLMQRYLSNLERLVRPAQVSVMQSHGGTLSAEQAGEHAVELLLSGPAGGLVGAQYQGRASGLDKLISFDMGGTSTDVALIDGEIRLTSEGEIAGYPVAVSMVDMHTIGAGGGSIAWLDEGGLLQVGPQSAGSSPGPACYGQGGKHATVTDANLVLGRLPHAFTLDEPLKLDIAASRDTLSVLAKSSRLSVEAIAKGVIRIANEHMAQALRVISVQRGFDPREFTLLSFGGAGGLHVCALAERLGMTQAMVPRHGGVLSALGLLVAPQVQQRSHTHIQRIEEIDIYALTNEYTNMKQRLIDQMQATQTELMFEESVDLRYQGQSSTLNLPWNKDLITLAKSFHTAHQKQFGHALGIAVELVTVRLRAELRSELPDFSVHFPSQPGQPHTFMSVVGERNPVHVYARKNLALKQTLEGPAIITESVSTTWLASGWRATNDTAGNLLLRASNAPE